MAATSALTIVNGVLARLREIQTTAGSFPFSAYPQLILKLVNDTKRECEDSWDWTMLRRPLSFNTVNGQGTYTLTGAGQRYRFYDRAKQIWNQTNRTQIIPAPQAQFDQWQYTSVVNNQFPNWYKVTGSDPNGDPTITLYPTPNGVFSIVVPLVIPEPDLVLYSDVFNTPPLPVELGTWARSISERGEDGGTASDLAWQMYQNALADHIALDAPRVADETVWLTV